MIFMTGDTHGDVRRLSVDSFYEQKELTKDDYLIILGDFGLVWDWQGESREERNWLNWLESKSFTTLFVDGNHENHDRLNEMPVEEWHGGKVHKIRPSVIHLMRGQIYNIDGLKVFTFGGACSHDITDGILEPGDKRIKTWSRDRYRLFRVNKRSWWERELPTQAEMDEGIHNLEKANWKVDFVLSHCAASDTASQLALAGQAKDSLTEYFRMIKQRLDYQRWFFGHYHMNYIINEKEVCLYDQIVCVKDNNAIDYQKEMFWP